MIKVTSYASGLYWRKSKWNGAKTVPVILSLDAGRLRMASAKEVAFDAPCAEVAARFTKLGTMVLTVGGRTYDVLGIGASLSPNFTGQQLDELRERRAAAAEGAVSPAAAGLTGVGAGGDVGAALDAAVMVGAVFDIKRMRENIRPWRAVLPAAGVRIET